MVRIGGSKAAVLLGVLIGAVAGFSWAIRLDEEGRRRTRKFFFELRELPRRVLI